MDRLIRLLFVGDVVGPAGRFAVTSFVPTLRQDLALDAVIVNGENSADNGFGVTAETAQALLRVADFVTLGDHAFDQKDIGPYLDQEPRIIRPLNFDQPVPGQGFGILTIEDIRIGILNLLGRLFMRPTVSSPFSAADLGIESLHSAGADAIVVDMQAEATSEKQGMGWYLAGRVAAVLGTHTHVPTADLRILPGGTAYVSDVGMAGGRDSVIGFDRERFVTFMLTGESQGSHPATGPAGLDAILILIDPATGLAVSAERVYSGE
jgi:2',3'-cyclic-nucleotide 2'-phosphodiesterase